MPADAPVPHELAELRFEGIVIATAHLLAHRVVVDPARNVRDVLRQPVVGMPCRAGQRCERFECGEHPIDRGLAVEGLSAPTRLEVTMFLQGLHRAAQRVPRSARVETPRSATQDAAHALGRARECALEPVVEGAVEQPVRFVLRRESPMETLGGGVIIGTSGRKMRLTAATIKSLSGIRTAMCWRTAIPSR